MNQEKNKATSKTAILRTSITIYAILTILVIFLPTLLKNYISATSYFALIGIFFLLSCYAIYSIAQRILALINAEKFHWMIASATAVLLYYERIISLDDLNRVFHIDASAMPIATIAIIFINFLELITIPLYLGALISAIVIALLILDANKTPPSGKMSNLLDFIEGIGSNEQPSTSASEIDTQLILRTTRFFFIFISCALAISSIWPINPSNKNSVIYRIALATDFSNSFNCNNISEKDYSALFIGPDQKRALFVAREKNEEGKSNNKPFDEALKNTDTNKIKMFIADCIFSSSTQD